MLICYKGFAFIAEAREDFLSTWFLAGRFQDAGHYVALVMRGYPGPGFVVAGSWWMLLLLEGVGRCWYDCFRSFL